MTLELGREVPCHSSYLTYYVRELGKVIGNCMHGVKYAVVGKDGVMEWKSQAGLIYVVDVCPMVNSKENMKVIVERGIACVVEYGLKVNEKKAMVVCINDEVGRRMDNGRLLYRRSWRIQILRKYGGSRKAWWI